MATATSSAATPAPTPWPAAPAINDIVSYASATRGGIIVDLATEKAKGDGHDDLSGFEDVVGSPQGDTIVGDGTSNRLDGGVGDDNLRAAAAVARHSAAPAATTAPASQLRTPAGRKPALRRAPPT